MNKMIEEKMALLDFSSEEKQIVQSRLRHFDDFDHAFISIKKIYQTTKMGKSFQEEEKISLTDCLKYYAIVRDMASLMPYFNRQTQKAIIDQDVFLGRLFKKMNICQKMAKFFEPNFAGQNLTLFGTPGTSTERHPLAIFEKLASVSQKVPPPAPTLS